MYCPKKVFRLLREREFWIRMGSWRLERSELRFPV